MEGTTSATDRGDVRITTSREWDDIPAVECRNCNRDDPCPGEITDDGVRCRRCGRFAVRVLEDTCVRHGSYNDYGRHRGAESCPTCYGFTAPERTP